MTLPQAELPDLQKEVKKRLIITYLILEVRWYTEASFLAHFLEAAAAPVDSTLGHKVANRQDY